jgi:hypothetical protein
MDIVQQHNIYTNVRVLQTFRSYYDNKSGIYTHIHTFAVYTYGLRACASGRVYDSMDHSERFLGI